MPALLPSWGEQTFRPKQALAFSIHPELRSIPN